MTRSDTASPWAGSTPLHSSVARLPLNLGAGSRKASEVSSQISSSLSGCALPASKVADWKLRVLHLLTIANHMAGPVRSRADHRKFESSSVVAIAFFPGPQFTESTDSQMRQDACSRREQAVASSK